MLQASIRNPKSDEWANLSLNDSDENILFDEDADEEDILETALDYLNSSRPDKADELLTTALMIDPSDYRLWLAAGLSRIRRGYIERAACAFKMASWLTGDPELFGLFASCEQLIV